MKYYILQSNVESGHYLNDIRRHVPHNSEIRVSEEQAQRSGDLGRAIQMDLIEVKETLESSDFSNESPSTTEESETVEDQTSLETSEVENLRRMNRELVTAVQELISQQKSLSRKQEKILSKMEDGFDQPLPSPHAQVLETSSQESDSSDSASKSSDQEPQTFIPEIRSDEAETSGDLEMEEEEEKQGDKLEEAAKIMEKMKEDD